MEGPISSDEDTSFGSSSFSSNPVEEAALLLQRAWRTIAVLARQPPTCFPARLDLMASAARDGQAMLLGAAQPPSDVRLAILRLLHVPPSTPLTLLRARAPPPSTPLRLRLTRADAVGVPTGRSLSDAHARLLPPGASPLRHADAFAMDVLDAATSAHLCSLCGALYRADGRASTYLRLDSLVHTSAVDAVEACVRLCEAHCDGPVCAVGRRGAADGAWGPPLMAGGADADALAYQHWALEGVVDAGEPQCCTWAL